MMNRNLGALREWQPPSSWRRIVTLDAHAGGEPLRVVLEGFPDLPGSSILEKRKRLQEYDHLRKGILWEPRGHREMYGCLLTAPVSDEADFGVLFMHNEGYSTMCGHGVIALATVAVQSGLVRLSEPVTVVRMDTPAGLVTARALVSSGQVRSVAFENVPSFVLALDQTIDIPGIGSVRYDLAFGGAFYAFVQAGQFGLHCTPEEIPRLVSRGMAIKRAIARSRRILHPVEEELSFLYGTIFIAPPLTCDANSRNVCVFAEGEVDRSPTGTGVSGRLAIHYARKEIEVDQKLVIESVIGSRFTGRVLRPTTFEGIPAVVPEVGGSASITGRHEFFFDPDDPLQAGFFI
jgi:proline racemase